MDRSKLDPTQRKEPGRYEIGLDGRWSFEDLYQFSKTYEQVYFFAYSITESQQANLPDKSFPPGVNYTYKRFPWHGGFSAVHFYDRLTAAVPYELRPEILAIEKKSPGYLAVGLWVSTAWSVAYVVRKIAESLKNCNDVYNAVMKDMSERKLMKLMLGFKNQAAVTKLTGHPFITLKILLSYYRRVRKLADMQAAGKIKLKDDLLE
jgi:hypothetical protein